LFVCLFVKLFLFVGSLRSAAPEGIAADELNAAMQATPRATPLHRKPRRAASAHAVAPHA
jgi:hypothetical protein